MAKDLKKLLTSKWRLRLYFLKSLPLAFIAGLQVEQLNDKQVSVSVPFNYINKNPFKSMYFASLSMAAELSTAIISLMAVSQAPVPVSMLVTNMQAQFLKKAKTKITFTCYDLEPIFDTVHQAVETGQGRTVTVKTTGIDRQGQVVAQFNITWSFKPKKSNKNAN